MSEDDRRDLYQRLQVGVIGLVAVLIFVSLANFIVRSASDEDLPGGGDAVLAENGDSPGSEAEPPKEPLAELGVALSPDAEAQGGGGQTPPAPAAEGEQIVPDLEPDPKLDEPMDRPR